MSLQSDNKSESKGQTKKELGGNIATTLSWKNATATSGFLLGLNDLLSLALHFILPSQVQDPLSVWSIEPVHRIASPQSPQGYQYFLPVSTPKAPVAATATKSTTRKRPPVTRAQRAQHDDQKES